MERLYHMTEDDTVIGPVNRNGAHRSGLLHRAGIVFVVRSDGKILLTWRSAAKETFPDMYDSSCAFHVTFGESYEEAAKRELREETGIHSNPKYLGKFAFGNRQNMRWWPFSSAESDFVPALDPIESTASNYHSPVDVDKIVSSGHVTPWLKEGWKLMKNKTRMPD